MQCDAPSGPCFVVPFMATRGEFEPLEPVANTTATQSSCSSSSSSSERAKALVRRAQHRKRQARARAFESQLPFSWVQCLASLFSLVLVCTDVPRSGLGINRHLAATTTLEPDVFQFYGPWHYGLQSTDAAHANETDARVWSYKSDTTSIVLRAFAKWYGLTTFPPCVLYKSACPDATLPGETVFAMMDSLATAASAKVRVPQTAPLRVVLRSENTYIDRFHHLLLPQIFATPIRRTNQLLYYSSELLARASNGELLSIETARRMCYGFAARPSFCNDLWTNFAHSCGKAGDSSCKRVGRVVEYTLQRVRAIQRRFPSQPIDLTYLESYEDVRSCRCGICLPGVRKVDVTAIARVRECSASACRTVYLDEFRFETGLVHSHAMQWYHVVATLRVIGQCYYYVRIAMLVVFCYRLVSDTGETETSNSADAVLAFTATIDRLPTPQSHSGVFSRVRRAGVLFLKTPMQTIIFGAPFPIVCYATAHAIDASVTYELLANIFTTQNGVFEVAFRDLCFVGFNQMRSVWLFAIALHASIGIRSFSRRALSWHPIDGVRGVPEFFLGAMASVTTIAQVRSTRIRNTHVRSVFQVADTPTLLSVKYQSTTAYHRGMGLVSVGGGFVDVKFFVCLILLFSAVLTVRRARLMLCSHRNHTVRQTKTPVSYAAGVLWPVAAMCVHWSDDYYCVKPFEPRDGDSIGTTLARSKGESRSLRALRKVRPWAPARAMDNLPSVAMTRRSFHSIRSQMEKLHERDDDVDATIAFMNLVAMSDPIVYFTLLKGGRSGTGKLLGYYQSRRHPDKVFLLPCEVVVPTNDHMRDLTLLWRVWSSALDFADLVHCG